MFQLILINQSLLSMFILLWGEERVPMSFVDKFICFKWLLQPPTGLGSITLQPPSNNRNMLLDSPAGRLGENQSSFTLGGISVNGSLSLPEALEPEKAPEVIQEEPWIFFCFFFGRLQWLRFGRGGRGSAKIPVTNQRLTNQDAFSLKKITLSFGIPMNCQVRQNHCCFFLERFLDHGKRRMPCF